MPLDKIILDHVEDIEATEEELSADIDRLINQIDIDEVIDNPSTVLIDFASAIVEMLREEYYPGVADKGIKFAQDVEKDGDVDVVLSNDPKLNEGLVDRGENS